MSNQSSLKIAVITPSFNQGRFIERTIQSVLSQSVPNLEYVIVDGQSQDETVAILQQYADKIRYVSEPDHGQAHAVNKGILMTSSDIIGWLNSDDIYYPDAIPQVLNFFQHHPDIDVVYGKADHINHVDQIIESYPTRVWNKNRLKQTCFISQPGVFFRRQVIERIGLLNEKLNFCMDYEYWLRLMRSGVRFYYFPQVLAGSRVHADTKTMSLPKAAQDEALAMLKNQLGYVPDSWLLNAAIDHVKVNSRWRRPQLRFLWEIYINGVLLSFQWNGVFVGIKTFFSLPQYMFQRL